MRRIHRLTAAAMSLAPMGLANAALLPAAALLMLGLFGTACIVATGAFLLAHRIALSTPRVIRRRSSDSR